MWMFWIMAGLLAAAAAALVIAAAGRAARMAAGGGEDPALPVYRRQLAELDELAQRGLLAADVHAASRTEAARRLLGHAAIPRRMEQPGAARSRMAVALAAAGAAVVALSLYLLLGAPSLPDQPYRQRVAAWRTADPATLDPARMSAVLLALSRERPHDPLAWEYLGRAQMAAGDAYAAANAFATAAKLSPGRADLLADEGEALIADDGGKVSDPARAVFVAAMKLNPQSTTARYYLGRSEMERGHVDAALSDWRVALANLTPSDPRRPFLEAQIALRGAVPPPAAQPGPAPGQTAFIHAMVDRQAAQLHAHPDDVQGWARLVRSYGVLGDAKAQADALATARRQFASRPDALKIIAAEAPGR